MLTVRDLLILNLTLQVFDGLFSYQAFSLGATEANPFVSAAISNWGVIYGLLYKKIFACALLIWRTGPVRLCVVPVPMMRWTQEHSDRSQTNGK